MSRHPGKYITRLAGIFCLLLSISLIASGCYFKTEHPVQTETQSSANSNNVSVEISWLYQDDARLGIELRIENYPLPQEASLNCPITRIDYETDGGQTVLYKNPDQISLDDFYEISRHNSWYCTLIKHQNGSADYLFSLNHFSEDCSLPDCKNYYQDDFIPAASNLAHIIVELGQITTVVSQQSVLVLPSQGFFQLDLENAETDKQFTWMESQQVEKNGIIVQINRVSMNPSASWLNACISIPDHHNWIPIVQIGSSGSTTSSVDYLLTYPTYPSTPFQSAQRCYIFTIPYTLDTAPSFFQVGITQVTLDNTNPGQVEMQDCEAVRQKIEDSEKIQITCWEYETNGQLQHWFQVVSHPEKMTSQEAYNLVKSAFTDTIVGPWMFSITH